MALTENTLNYLTKITPILLGAYVFLNPFAFKLTALSEICFYLSTAFTAILVYYKRIDFNFKTPLTIPFVLLLGWAFIGLFFAVYKGNSIHDFYRHLVRYIVVFYLLVNFFGTRKSLDNLGWTVVVSGSLFLTGLIVYFYFIFKGGAAVRIDLANIKNNEFGFIGLPVLFLSLFYYEKIKISFYKILLLIPVLSSTIVIIQSFGSLLGLLCSLPILVYKRKKSVLMYLGIVIFLVVIIKTAIFPLPTRAGFDHLRNKIHSDHRIGIWALYLNVVKDYPVTGIGYGLEMWQYQDFWNKYTAKVPDSILSPDLKVQKVDPHNMFLSIAVHLGIVGLIIFLYLLFVAFRSLFKLIRKGRGDYIKDWAVCALALLVGYLAKAMSEEALSNIGALMFYYTMAVIVIIGYLNKEMDLQGKQTQIKG